MIKIGLLWHNYPSENLGVAALSICHLSLLDEALEQLGINAEYFVAGMTKNEENSFIDATSRTCNYIQFSLRNIAKNPSIIQSLKSNLSECAIIFDLSEGDSFTDIYGVRRFAQQVLSKWLIIAAKRVFVFCPQTLGPFDKWYGRLISRWIMKHADRLFARDEQSYDYLRGMGLGDNIELTTDLAFALPFNRDFVSLDKNFFHVGLNVSGLLFNGGYSGSNQFGLNIDYKAFVRNYIEMFNEMENVKVHLVPHVISDKYEIEDDYRVSEILCKEYPDCLLAPRFKTPIEAKSYIASLDFFSGARMHATIAAFSCDVPVVPVAYSRKFSGMFGSLGYDCLVDGTSATNESGLSLIRNAFEERAVLKERIRRGNIIAQERLGKYRNYLFDVLKSSCSGKNL